MDPLDGLAKGSLFSILFKLRPAYPECTGGTLHIRTGAVRMCAALDHNVGLATKVLLNQDTHCADYLDSMMHTAFMSAILVNFSWLSKAIVASGGIWVNTRTYSLLVSSWVKHQILARCCKGRKNSFAHLGNLLCSRDDFDQRERNSDSNIRRPTHSISQWDNRKNMQKNRHANITGSLILPHSVLMGCINC